ncbi:hypothetical protein QQP08_024226, partial [Theobroma cacao]
MVSTITTSLISNFIMARFKVISSCFRLKVLIPLKLSTSLLCGIYDQDGKYQPVDWYGQRNQIELLRGECSHDQI